MHLFAIKLGNNCIIIHKNVLFKQLLIIFFGKFTTNEYKIKPH